MSLFRLSFLAPFLIGVIALAGCESFEAGDSSAAEDGFGPEYSDKRKTVFGDGGLTIFGDEEPSNDGGVNVFLWRASLDTVSFMPVNSADVFGGVILTDWHSSAEAPNERFKLYPTIEINHQFLKWVCSLNYQKYFYFYLSKSHYIRNYHRHRHPKY